MSDLRIIRHFGVTGISDTITPLLFSDPSFREIYENGFASLFITDLDRSVKACVVLFYWLLQHRRSAIGILLGRRLLRRSTLNLLHSCSVRVLHHVGLHIGCLFRLETHQQFLHTSENLLSTKAKIDCSKLQY